MTMPADMQEINWPLIGAESAAEAIGNGLGMVVHSWAPTRTGVLATLMAAEKMGRHTIAYFPANDYYIDNGISLAGFSCQIRGAGAGMRNATVPSGTVFYANTQNGPVLDFKGWVYPNEFKGKVTHNGFAIRGSGVADPSKNNIGLRVDFIESTTFSDIAIMDTGGPGLKITADVPGYACYLSDFERIIISTPVGAGDNDVPYFHSIEANGNRFRGFGFISRVPSNDTGVSGAVVIEGSSTYRAHTNLYDAWWFENLHVKTDGCLVAHSGVANRLIGFQFFDIKREAGATNTTHVKLLPSVVENYGGNYIDMEIPGDNNGGGSVPHSGIVVSQPYNRIEGIKGYRGNNVVINTGIGYTFVHLKGSRSSANSLGWVDNSGVSTNHLIDEYMNITVLPGGAMQDSVNNGVRYYTSDSNKGSVFVGKNGAGIQAIGSNSLQLKGDLVYISRRDDSNVYSVVLGTDNTNSPAIHVGTVNPEGNRAAPPGSLYLRTAGGGASTTLYVKESGTGNTGWVGK